MSADLLLPLSIQLLPLVIALAVALYKILIQYLPASKQEHLGNIVDNVAQIAHTVVRGIEQSMPGETGQMKKVQAANDIESILGALGISVAPQLVSGAIEASVYAMNLAKPAQAAEKPAA